MSLTLSVFVELVLCCYGLLVAFSAREFEDAY